MRWPGAAFVRQTVSLLPGDEAQLESYPTVALGPKVRKLTVCVTGLSSTGNGVIAFL